MSGIQKRTKVVHKYVSQNCNEIRRSGSKQITQPLHCAGTFEVKRYFRKNVFFYNINIHIISKSFDEDGF